MDLQPSTLWSAGRSQPPLSEESMESSGRKARHACEAGSLCDLVLECVSFPVMAVPDAYPGSSVDIVMAIA